MADLLKPIWTVAIVVVLILSDGALQAEASKTQEVKQEHKAVMLARNWDPSIDITGWWISEKLDGVRGCWTGKKMVSRSGKLIQTPQWFVKNFPPFALDGELWMGRGQFNTLSGIVRRKVPDREWEKVKYFIFDVPSPGIGFERRLEKARRWFESHPSTVAEILEQIPCRGREHLEAELKKTESLGGEGLMLRRPGSLYKYSRSSDMLKVKTFHDMEAVVVGHNKGTGRNSGRLGSIVVELPGGVRFSIGSGFSDNERINPPPVGSVVTFRYKEFNASGVPRFATFLRVKETF